MAAEPGALQVFYASAWQHPVSLWAAAGLGAVLCLARPGLDPALRRYCLALVALSLLDAWLTSSPVWGVGTLEGAAAQTVPLCFVLAGDLRYWLLLQAATPDGRFRPGPRSVAAALGLTLIVPLASQGILALLPPAWSTPRVLFLCYELAFAALLLGLLRGHPKLRAGSWLRQVSRFVLLYYALWAAADAVILATGSDLGFGLRLLPNWLYYGGLVPAIAWLAPRAGRS